MENEEMENGKYFIICSSPFSSNAHNFKQFSVLRYSIFH